MSVIIVWSSGAYEHVLRDDTGSCDEGLELVTTGDETMIELCPATCARVRLDPDADVFLVLPCTET